MVFFLGFSLLYRHTVSKSITSDAHTSGAQNKRKPGGETPELVAFESY